MTQPPDATLAVIQVNVTHQNETLKRIENKLDKSLDDLEARMRKVEAADPAGTREAVEALQQSDKRWAAAAIVLAFVVPAVMRLLWP